MLDMGTPIKIVDLARQMIELSGFVPNEDIEIKFTGLRPGEKLFEEIHLDREEFSSTSHSKILRFDSNPESLDEMRESLEQLRLKLPSSTSDEIRAMIQARVPEYQPPE